MSYHCPECDLPFDTLEGVSMHYVNMEDGSHENYESKYHVKRAVEDNQQTVSVDSLQTVSDGGDSAVGDDLEEEQSDSDTDSEYSLPEFETETETAGGSKDESNTETPSCCDNPELDGSAGDLFRLDDGEIIRLDSGEQICVNCDEVSE